ncbi:uncharacterized protein G2W53_038303 [Senna tora]|uniref:Uncharacterized protein n=1 Tax=Senna tora TaxID=362788 RepID=A0A834SLU1_9FABA|nr:uncharacterized protein G2W53_038303 [Senna tora]
MIKWVGASVGNATTVPFAFHFATTTKVIVAFTVKERQ